MKHKIAVYGNGWNLEALQQTLEGVKRYAELEDFDTFVFCCQLQDRRDISNSFVPVILHVKGNLTFLASLNGIIVVAVGVYKIGEFDTLHCTVWLRRSYR